MIDGQAEISARLERLPITRRVFWTRNIIGAATFFDGYTVIAIAYAMPVLVREWGLDPQQTGLILSMGYLGQIFGAVLFGWLAERLGRLKILLFTILLFVSMDIACLFATGAAIMMLFRFVQGIGTGGEVPVASRLHQRIHRLQGPRPLLPALRGDVPARPRRRRSDRAAPWCPTYGWQAMFLVGLDPGAGPAAARVSS